MGKPTGLSHIIPRAPVLCHVHHAHRYFRCSKACRMTLGFYVLADELWSRFICCRLTWLKPKSRGLNLNLNPTFDFFFFFFSLQRMFDRSARAALFSTECAVSCFPNTSVQLLSLLLPLLWKAKFPFWKKLDCCFLYSLFSVLSRCRGLTAGCCKKQYSISLELG